MLVSCKVCQSEEAVNPQSEYPVCETCAVEFYETAMKQAAQQSVQTDAVIEYCNCTWPEPQGGYFCVTCSKPRR